MTPRHIVLVLASAAVLAMGVYLWKEVNESPATADVTKHDKPAPPPPPVEDTKPEKQPEVAKAPPPPPPVKRDPVQPVTQPTSQDTAPAVPDVVNEELGKPNPKLDAVMAEANKAYDRGDFDDAKDIAVKVLAKEPNNVRMLRIVVSAACIDGDSTQAQKSYSLLPGADREQMKIRCARYGVQFNDTK